MVRSLMIGMGDLSKHCIFERADGDTPDYEIMQNFVKICRDYAATAPGGGESAV
jgi:hypothetical protein